MSKKKEFKAGLILIIAGFALLLLSRISKGFAQWYSTRIYIIWVHTLGRLAGAFPYSLSEMLLYVLVVGFLITGIWTAVKKCRKRTDWKNAIAWTAHLFLAVAVLFFLYVVNCGINYHRESFADGAGIVVEDYSKEDLKEVCQWLTREVNGQSRQIDRDEKGVMCLSSGAEKQAVKAMQKLGEKYPEMAGYYPIPKKLIVPWELSVQNLSGIYLPFMIEANYNNAMIDYNIPFTMCHELSHLRGFMQEKEANFIAFLACRESESAQFRYSGNLLGWIYCMNVLYQADYEAWEEVRSGLSEEVEADLQANREFWAKYDGAVAEVSNKINDTYLKANGQNEGVESYDRMVDLIVAYYKGTFDRARKK